MCAIRIFLADRVPLPQRVTSETPGGDPSHYLPDAGHDTPDLLASFSFVFQYAANGSIALVAKFFRQLWL
jgi:hypothetical protein